MRKMRYNLRILKARLEVLNDKAYSFTDIAAAAGVSVQTMTNVTGNKTARADFKVLMALLDFFESEGMPITLCDLFIITKTDAPTASSPPLESVAIS